MLVVFFVLYQQSQDNVLQNIVYSKTVALSPLIVFIAALLGAALGGIVGVLLAIPLTSAAWVLASDLIALRRDRAERRGGREATGRRAATRAGPDAEPQAEDDCSPRPATIAWLRAGPAVRRS